MPILFLLIKCYLVPLSFFFCADSSLSRPSFGDLIHRCGKIEFWPFKNSCVIKKNVKPTRQERVTDTPGNGKDNPGVKRESESALKKLGRQG